MDILFKYDCFMLNLDNGGKLFLFTVVRVLTIWIWLEFNGLVI